MHVNFYLRTNSSIGQVERFIELYCIYQSIIFKGNIWGFCRKTHYVVGNMTGAREGEEIYIKY